MKKLIKNGLIITAGEQYQADLLIDGETIIQIGANLDSINCEVIDAEGLYVLPGAVDEHTHMSMPFNGTESMPWETETIAAAVGGTTTIVDFAIQKKGESILTTIERWKERASRQTAIDYSLHVAITDLNETVLDDIPKAVEQGVTTFKIFMAYKGEMMMDDTALFQVLKATKNVGGLVMVHAENGDVISLLQKSLMDEGCQDPIYHAESRPIEIEAEATRRAIALAKTAEAPIFIVHVSGEEPAEEIRRAKAKGQPVFAETCPHYLFLDKSYLELPDFEGGKYVCSPPLRETYHQKALWDALTDRTIEAIGTDHCSFNFKEQKHLGKEDFTKIPNGGNGIENWLQMMYTHGVKKGYLSLTRMVELVAANPAKFMGLFPRKGAICVGADADIVLFDPNKSLTITAENQKQGSDYNFYEGFEVDGTPRHVFLRGQWIVKDGEYTGDLAQGKFIPSNPYGEAYKTGQNKGGIAHEYQSIAVN